jgi:hypothetical protein
MLFLVTKKLFNASAGFWAVVVMNLSAVFTVPIACWFQPDAPLMFFWLLSTYFMVDVLGITSQGTEKLGPGRVYLLWILVGISMGLAILSKYHTIFLFLGALIFIISNKNQRHWLHLFCGGTITTTGCRLFSRDQGQNQTAKFTRFGFCAVLAASVYGCCHGSGSRWLFNWRYLSG